MPMSGGLPFGITKGPLSSGALTRSVSNINRGPGDNSGARYEILAPAGRFIMSHMGSDLVAFNPACARWRLFVHVAFNLHKALYPLF